MASRWRLSVRRIKDGAARIGLELNENKCEAVSGDGDFIAAVRSMLPECAVVAPTECVLLGAAVGDEAVSSSIGKRESALARAGWSAGARRTARRPRPPASIARTPAGRLRAARRSRLSRSSRPSPLTTQRCVLYAESVMNVALDDRAWRQCSFAAWAGGIGIRAPSDLALPAFLSSVAATATLADRYQRRRAGRPDSGGPRIVGGARGLSGPVGPAFSARSWQRPLDEARFERLQVGSSRASRRCPLALGCHARVRRAL